MKINAINNTINKNFYSKTTAQKQLFNVQKDTFELSFTAKKTKYSKEFLELTKGDKFLQSCLKELCMLDENKEFNPEYEKYFLDMVRNLEEEDKSNPSTLRHFAVAINTARKLNCTEEAIPYFLGNIMALSENNYLDNEIERIFNSKDFSLSDPTAYVVLQELFGNRMTFDEKGYFLNTFCKNPDGSTDVNRIAGLVALFELIEPDCFNISEKILNMLLDKDGSFNLTKCAFAIESIEFLVNYIEKNDPNFAQLLQEDSSQAKTLIVNLLKGLIYQNETQNGEFDIEKARESLSAWVEYAQNNKAYLNETLFVEVHDLSEQSVSQLSVNRLIKKYPHRKIYFDNLPYRLCSLITYPKGKIN